MNNFESYIEELLDRYPDWEGTMDTLGSRELDMLVYNALSDDEELLRDYICSEVFINENEAESALEKLYSPGNSDDFAEHFKDKLFLSLESHLDGLLSSVYASVKYRLEEGEKVDRAMMAMEDYDD